MGGLVSTPVAFGDAQTRVSAPHPQHQQLPPPHPFAATFAQVSLSETGRLKTGGSPGVSESTTKYPRRSNWKRDPAAAPLTEGSSFACGTTSSELGLMSARKSWPSSGNSLRKSRS